MTYRTPLRYRTFLYYGTTPNEHRLSDYPSPSGYQTFSLTLLSDMPARRARHVIGPKDFLSFFLAFLYNISYHRGRMINNTKTKGDEMTTKIIGLCVTAAIGWIVVSKVIGIFTHVTEQLQTVTSF